MCCTFEPAELANTTLYCGEHMHPNGKRVHVIGYQNTVENHHGGANAMIIPFPSAARMGPENILDTSKTPNVLQDMVTALRSTYDSARGFDESFGELAVAAAGSAQVFESGKYTVVLADDPRQIKAALERVPANRRPRLNQEIMVAYAHWYPKWPVALCCFNGREMHPADPLLWWYEPQNPERLFLPTLDAHDGHRPDLKKKVALDHALLAGISTRPCNIRQWNNRAGRLYYTDREIPEEMSHYLPSGVIGVEMTADRSTPRAVNGDFYMNVSDLREANAEFHREPPPGHAALF